jgi:putative tryptophan/tyrosine transport system substrate-binding protein
MRRREFILGGASAAILLGPKTARPQAKQIRRVAVLIGLASDDPEARRYFEALRSGMQTLGWVDGQNVLFDVRAAADVAGVARYAKELVALSPDVIVTNPTPATFAVKQVTQTVAVVFTAVSDPISTGFAQSFPRPGGNITGFTNFEPGIGGKWLELLHEIAPSITRVSMMFNPATTNSGANGGVYLPSIEAAARTQSIEFMVAPVREPPDIDAVLEEISKRPGGGLLVMPNTFTIAQRKRIVAQAARWPVPAIYPISAAVKDGGLISYAVDIVDLFRRAASYVDRILKGAVPDELPIQQPTKFELLINLRTAKTLGLTVPNTLLVSADEVIE